MIDSNSDAPTFDLSAQALVERTLHYCVVCLIDLPTDGTGWLQCAACDEPRCYECESGCLCDRMKANKKK